MTGSDLSDEARSFLSTLISDMTDATLRVITLLCIYRDQSGGSRCALASLYKLCDFSRLTLVVPQFGRTLEGSLATRRPLRASAKASPADEQQQISADSAGRLRPDLPIRNNYTGLIFDQVSCRTRGFNI